MSTPDHDVVDALRATLKERDRLRKENDRLLSGAEEPIAIVGMACRFPGGVATPEQLWDLVSEGREGIRGFPEDRGWDVSRLFSSDPEAIGTSYASEGGFLDDVAGFDASFFGIGPREALASDPQHRLTLECSWEALEAAGLDPLSLKRTQTGVFVGLIFHEYGSGTLMDELEGYRTLGLSSGVASGRVAYTLGLEGPAITVDTACSSSLVTMHLAAQALRRGECSLALAGGASVIFSPDLFVDASRQRGLAPDGRCKAFAEAADGVALAEGAGMIALERLSDAQRNGRRILAVIRGSAVNQDGASNGLAAPSGPAQERVIRQALANARLEPKDVDFVEAHGTGTPLGDPIEANALLATYGRDRERPLKLGSVKSNIGHTQAAAGVAGVIKAVLAMQAGVLPKTLHLDAPSSKIEWESGAIELLAEASEWQPNGRPRRAAVSAFGISGTNAHLILEEAPAATAAEEEGEESVGEAGGSAIPGQVPLVLSARSEPALRESAGRLASHLELNPELDLGDVAYSLATCRPAFERRAVAVGGEREELRSALTAFAAGGEDPGLIVGGAREDRRPVFLFPGYGSQWQGMALELIESSPVFARRMSECAEALEPHMAWSLDDILHGAEGLPEMDWLEVGAPALFAAGVSLAALWRSCGVEPAAVAGHSQGELIAANVAGALSLDEAARAVVLRSRLMVALKDEKGTMAAVALSAEELESRLQQWDGRIEIASLNGPGTTIVTGDREPIEELLAQCGEEGTHTREIRGAAGASHSFHVEKLRDEVLEAFAPISPRSSEVPFHSTVTGGLLDTAELDAEYWYRNLRQTVRLAPVVHDLIEAGNRTLIEISPHPVLTVGLRETADATEHGHSVSVLGTLRRGEGGPNRFAISFAQAQAAGAAVEWETFFADAAAKAVPLPTYPFQHERYWLSGSGAGSNPSAIGLGDAEHPLLGATIEQPDGDGVALAGHISLQSHPWLADHAGAGTVIFPGTGFVELALRAGQEVGCGLLEELILLAPLIVPDSHGVALRVIVGAAGDHGERSLAIHSRPESSERSEWTLHAEGVVSATQPRLSGGLAEWPPAGAEALGTDAVYDRLADCGFEYGPAFQGLTAAWRLGEEVFAEVSLADDQASEAARFGLHPALLDAAMHAMLLAALSEGDGELSPKLPFAWSGVAVLGAGAGRLRARLSIKGDEEASLLLADEEGTPVAIVDSVRVRTLPAAAVGKAAKRTGLLGLKWTEVDPGGPAAADAGTVKLVELDGLDFGASASVPEAARAATASALAAAQEWLAAESRAGSRLVFLTRNAVAAGDEESLDLASAAAWGLLRTAKSEHPGRISLIDSDGRDSSAGALDAAIALGAEEPELALREGKLLAPRLVEAEGLSDSPAPAAAIDPESTVLITGGTGGLGGLFARHLVSEHGVRQLLLVSRSGAEAEGADELAAGLAELGAAVRIEACDVSDRAGLEELLASIDPVHPLGAVIHTAAGLANSTIESMDVATLDQVFPPKLDAAWYLHELTRGLDLSAFALFSSIAGTLGNPGQGNYAAANAFLDALAAQRRSEGLAATSMAWGFWAESGGAGAQLGKTDLARMERAGIAALSDAEGLELFDAALGSDLAQTVAAPFNRGALRSLGESGALPPVLKDLIVGSRRRRGSASGGSLAAQLVKLSEENREPMVLDLVRGEAAAVLGHSSLAAVEPDRPFKDLGFDSLAAVELRNRLSLATGLEMPAAVGFDYPTPRDLAGYLLREASDGVGAERVVVRAQATEEPVAIVGMACRFPGGVDSPQGLWELVAEGRDAITGFPTNRGWDLGRLFHPDPDNPGTTHVREGGFLHEGADFDPQFFGISPREALAADPQQRLLLETAWEALEDAGIDPFSLRGSPTGIFAGISSQDYSLSSATFAEELEGYLMTGAAPSVASGRIAYTLGLEGPAITIDTACSSSLVAAHLAAGALRSGECTLALAGAVTVVATPKLLSEFSRQRGIAPDGRCKAFAEAADGVGTSEGVGVLTLERLSDAEANGHRVLATIRGSAINQDGASNGLTAPNGPSQERVIRQALANARLKPNDVDAVEAHGTGTTLGDPIEAGALLTTYGQERERPLLLGSIKSNIGHAQAAAGMAGLIKTVMAMRESVLPKTLHVDAPSSKIEWEAGEIELLTEPREWKANGRPRRVGVSAFGISGTNAHMILEEGPPPAEREERDAGDDAGPLPVVLTAKSPAALRESAARLAARFEEDPTLAPIDVAYSLLTSRAAMEERAVVLGSDREQLLEGLRSLATGELAPGTHLATARSGRLAYLFTGQGSQRAAMGEELYEAYPAYAEALDGACAAIDEHLDRSLKEVLFAEPGSAEAELLDHTTYAQPALLATEVALYRLFESLGLKPDLLTGHSVGEIVAAHLAGVFSLADAARLICARGRLMGALPEGGAMLAIEATEQEALASIEDRDELLSLAAVNGPTATVISGDAEAIAAVEASWQEQDRRTKRLTVSHAFHSPLIEPMLAEFASVVESLELAEPKLAVVSNTSGELLSGEQATDPAYWVTHARAPVRFADGIATLAEQGATTYLELGPDAVLIAMAAGCLESEAVEPALIATLREGREETEAVALALGAAYASGARVQWSAFFAGKGAVTIPLPTYPFQRKPYWLSAGTAGSDPSAIGQSTAEHPLLAAVVEDPRGEGLVLTGRVSLHSHPWLADHAIGDTVLVPGTAFVELALAAGDAIGAPALEELTLQAPLVLGQDGGVQLQVEVEQAGADGDRRVFVHARPEPGPDEAEPQGWTCHAEGILVAASSTETEAFDLWPPAGAEPVDVDGVYDRLAAAGAAYGPAFQGLTAAWRLGDDVYAEVSLAEEQAAEAGRYGVHPALLDAAMHGLIVALEKDGEGVSPRLPFAWEDIALDRRGAQALRVKLSVEGEEGFSFVLGDSEGGVVGRVGSLRARPVSFEALGAAPPREDLLLLEWSPVAAEASAEEAAVKLVSLDDLDFEPSPDPAKGVRAATKSALALVQERLAEVDTDEAPLALLTNSAVVTRPGESPDLAAAAVWGMLRSAQAEHPGRFALIDSDGSQASRAALPAALALSATESQLAIREGQLLAPRIGAAAAEGDALVPPVGPWVLDAPRRGTLEGLTLMPFPEALQPLEPGEVRVAVRASGVNFRDVMAVLALYPGEASIGGEGAGVVVEVGPEVDDLAVGDRVCGMLSGAFGPLAVAKRELIAPTPPEWSFSQAAAMPAASLTARYGLVDLAGLEQGEKILVHAGAGGVGMAAIQLAHHLGAEVFATASPSKWGALRDLGVAEDHLASSRDLEFKQRFLEQTGGEGVDVVLNSLTGEFIDASLQLLPRGGRFLEMGKADLRDPEQLASRHSGVTYRVYDLGEAGFERMQEMLVETIELLERGELRHPPSTSWDVRRPAEAFRSLREGKNVGKVVLEMPQPFDSDRTVLVTGATGGIGSLVARHLVERHAVRHLLLVSRSGPDADGAAELATSLTALGASVRVEACDVGGREQLEELLGSIDPAHPLGAVVHSAGVVADGMIESMDAEQLQSVFPAKLDAAWNLHELTKGLDLSAFVLFSSMAGTLGAPGQANYAAANAFLDSLAQHREAEGLPATSMAWGLWARESGMTAGLGDSDRARARRIGVGAISDEQGLAFFDTALVAGRAVTLPVSVDSAGLRVLDDAGALPPILAGLASRRGERRSAPTVSLAERLAGLPEAEHEATVLELVRGEAAAVLGHASAEEVPVDRPFNELGFDSLAAVEMRNRLGFATGLRIPATVVFDHPTVAALAGFLLGEIGEAGKANAEAELGRLEVALGAIPTDDPGRSGLAAHLRALAADLEGGDGDGDSQIDRLEAASDEELLDFIDEQVGA